MQGNISIVENHGSVVVVWIDVEDGRTLPVYFDARPFGWLLEGEGCETSEDLIGRPICFDGESIEFLDNVEVA